MPVALITGGASFIARGIAKQLIDDGWQIVLADIDTDGMEKVAAELGGTNAVGTEVLDVTDLDAVKAVVARVVEAYGSIDGLVTAHGGLRGLGYDVKPFTEITPDEWRHTINVNLVGVMNCCQAALPEMKKAGKGSIINIAAGLTGAAEKSIYSAAKAGCNRFFQAIAQEVGPYGIRVNSVAPGAVDARWRTKQTRPPNNVSPLGRQTTPGDVGHAVAFLMSDDADHITGTIMDTSGGTALH